MIPCLYKSTETAFATNGIGKLADTESCKVTEKRNGSFELVMKYPADGIHAGSLTEGNIILAKCADAGQSQPFHIYKVTTPLNGQLEVCARHISYQLNFITVSPFSAANCTEAMAGLKAQATTNCPFSFQTDITTVAAFHLKEPASLRNCLGGMDGSVLDCFGGEYEWDRYTVTLHKARGTDRGVRITYGKNLVDFKMERNIENVITGVHPFWKDSETGDVLELSEKIVTTGTNTLPYEKITVLDCSGDFEEKPTEDALRIRAKSYLKTTSLTEPEVDIDIDFVQLRDTEGYEDVAEAERVSLCDTVHVYIAKLGIEASAKVTETTYDCLLERYSGITLSNAVVRSRANSLAGSLSEIRDTAQSASRQTGELSKSLGEVESKIEKAQSTADSAKSTAANAQSTANSAQSTAANAQSTANSAKSAADSAKTSADSAKSTASDTDTLIRKWCYANDTTYIDGGKIYAGSITAEKIAAGSITADNIKAGTITADNLSNGAVTTLLWSNSSPNEAYANGSVDIDGIYSMLIIVFKGASDPGSGTSNRSFSRYTLTVPLYSAEQYGTMTRMYMASMMLPMSYYTAASGSYEAGSSPVLASRAVDSWVSTSKSKCSIYFYDAVVWTGSSVYLGSSSSTLNSRKINEYAIPIEIYGIK